MNVVQKYTAAECTDTLKKRMLE